MKPHKNIAVIYGKHIQRYSNSCLPRLICKPQQTNNLLSKTPGSKLSWKTTSDFAGYKHKVIIIKVLKVNRNFHEKFI